MSRVVLFKRDSIQRSCSASSCRSARRLSGSTAAPSEFIKQKRAAFQILLAKLRYDSTCFSFQRVSVLPTEASMMRVASTPYLSNTSSGSTPFIFVFDMRWPCFVENRSGDEHVVERTLAA